MSSSDRLPTHPYTRCHRRFCCAGGVLLATVGGGAMLYDSESDYWHVVSQDDSSRFQPLLLHCETGDPDLADEDVKDRNEI